MTRLLHAFQRLILGARFQRALERNQRAAAQLDATVQEVLTK